MTQPKKILIAPLNWGLGHATRCIPIIDELLRQGAEVILASDGAALELLKKEYPHLPCHALPAYDIRYPFESMVLSMAVQMPKILRGCLKEHFWLNNFLKNNKIDVVISDNRFGFYNKKVKSIFMTHQINIAAPFQFLVNKINRYFIQKFDVCWIPDFETVPNLAGQLSHFHKANSLEIQYLGALSRMKKYAIEKKYKAIIILSGPEPQRTILEKIIIEQLQKEDVQSDLPPKPPLPPKGGSSQKEGNQLDSPPQSRLGRDIVPPYLLVRGVTINDGFELNYKNIEIHNYLITKDLNQKILESEVMIARSGYSTIMDLVNLGMKAILIPTPGQTEQEYLATELMKNHIFYSQTQSELNLKQAFQAVENYKGFDNFFSKNDTLPKIISELLKI